MNQMKFNYRTPAALQEKKGKMVDEILKDNKIRKVIEELNITMEEINNRLGLFIRLLDSNEECKDCNNKECKFIKKGMVPYLVRDEFNELNIKYTLCDLEKDNRKKYLNYLYKDFDSMFDKIDFTNIDPSVVSVSGDAYKNNIAIATKLMEVSLREINRENNFIIFGKRGSGKSAYCAALTNTLVDKDYKCAYIDLRKFMAMLISKIGMKDNDGYANAIDIVSNVEVLVIENLGDEKISDWSRTILSDILSSRNRSDKFTIISSSHYYEDLESLYSAIKGETNYRANKIKAQDLLSQIKTLCKNEYKLRSE